MKQIRGKSIVVLRNEDRFLFTVCIEREKNELFYIPVGGGIEFGEYSLNAAKREVWEEIGKETENEKLLGITENIFCFNGTEEHEIVFVYAADFKDKAAYELPLQAGLNAEGNPIKLAWITVDELEKGNFRVYPEGLLKMIQEHFPGLRWNPGQLK